MRVPKAVQAQTPEQAAASKAEFIAKLEAEEIAAKERMASYAAATAERRAAFEAKLRG